VYEHSGEERGKNLRLSLPDQVHTRLFTTHLPLQWSAAQNSAARMRGISQLTIT